MPLGKRYGLPYHPPRQRSLAFYLVILAILFVFSVVVGIGLGLWSNAREGEWVTEMESLAAAPGMEEESAYGSGGPLEPALIEPMDQEEDSTSLAAMEGAELSSVELSRHSYTISSNDNLYTALQCFGVPRDLILSWCDLAKSEYDLSRLKPGQSFDLYRSASHEFMRFELDIGGREKLVIEKEGEGYHAFREEGEPESETESEPSAYYPLPCWVDPPTGRHYYHGEISSNFYDSAMRAGMTPGKTMALIRVFGSVNFDTGIRDGDRFSVVVGPGEAPGEEGYILAAMVESAGRPHYLFRFEESGQAGYFDEKGRTTRSSALLCPVRYTRISSYFTYRRFHPVRHVYRPHLGVDYAAPAGTPVRAAASGRVISAGWKGEFGRSITILHNKEFKTQYSHLSRLARGIKSGKWVSQGQVIGYVGSTGLASGSHLDYRVFRNGRPVNPLRVTGMPGPPVKDKQSFETVKQTMMTELEKDLPLGPPLPAPDPEPVQVSAAAPSPEASD